MRPLIITGCQRSALSWIAGVISASGWGTTHEHLFNERDHTDHLTPQTIEASWAAAPYLPRLPDAYVVHQIRHPLAVVASLIAHGSITGSTRAQAQWAIQFVPEIDHLPSRPLRLWIAWNKMVEECATARWRVEDLTATKLAVVLTATGRRTPISQADRALLTPHLPTDRRIPPLEWSDLGPPDLVDEARDLATRYGYAT